ncbi:hypothetical protein HPB51_027069 [Rhipicephalus microplus]|uniref:Uncharacterized protein n=1 Tax=Rhipicephalus microplus TaxID=6941 RepID=A0A9J6D154_RHIMP|nr:hypothetical protein HPB51_027069 [Rhipicephalus microplus]
MPWLRRPGYPPTCSHGKRSWRNSVQASLATVDLPPLPPLFGHGVKAFLSTQLAFNGATTPLRTNTSHGILFYRNAVNAPSRMDLVTQPTPFDTDGVQASSITQRYFHHNPVLHDIAMLIAVPAAYFTAVTNGCPGGSSEVAATMIREAERLSQQLAPSNCVVSTAAVITGAPSSPRSSLLAPRAPRTPNLQTTCRRHPCLHRS